MKIRKNEWGRKTGKYAGRALAVLTAALVFIWCDPIVSRAEATGTVLPSSVYIREKPEQGSEVIGSSSAGKEITIRGKVDSSGTTWYQVYVDANTLGYVRADMIERKGEGDIPTVSVAAEAPAAQTQTSDEQEQAQPTASSGGGAQVEAQEAMDLQYASTNVQAKVRPDPSTSNNHVDSLTPGTQVVVSGKSEGSDGKTWYYVTFTGANGSEKTGYIRADLLDLGELLPVEEAPEEEPVTEPVTPPETQRNDYELKIETNSEGEEVWYLHDNIKGNKEPLAPLLESSYAQSVDDKDDTGTIVKQRIVIVVLAVLLAALAVTVIIMAFKLRDAYYEDYEDDEEEEDDRASQRRAAAEKEKEKAARRRTADEEERPRRRESAEAPKPERAKREREVTYREEPETEAVRQPAPKRKTKNFLLDDDEFEFEFLNMDDKDLK